MKKNHYSVAISSRRGTYYRQTDPYIALHNILFFYTIMMKFNLSMSIFDFAEANASYYQQRFEEDCEGTGINVQNPDNFSKREQDHQEEIIEDFQEAKFDFEDSLESFQDVVNQERAMAHC